LIRAGIQYRWAHTNNAGAVTLFISQVRTYHEYIKPSVCIAGARIPRAPKESTLQPLQPSRILQFPIIICDAANMYLISPARKHTVENMDMFFFHGTDIPTNLVFVLQHCQYISGAEAPQESTSVCRHMFLSTTSCTLGNNVPAPLIQFRRMLE